MGVSLILTFGDDGTVTCSGISASADQAQTAKAVETVTASFPAAGVVSDPWADEAPWPAATTTTPAAPAAPACPHGPRRFVPAGVSKSGPRAGQPYPAFWGCNADRSDPTKCKSLPA